MGTQQPFEEMIKRLKAKNFDPASAQNIAFRVIRDEESAELLKYMDKNPEADEYDLIDEADRIMKSHSQPRRNRTK